MDKNAIKKYAVWARRELIERVSQRAMIYGITAKDAGDPNAESVNDHLLSQAEKRQRQALIRNIKEKGYEQVMEEVAYTWFNRFAALRFMEVNGYLPSHIRVFTNDVGEFKPQILAEAIHLEMDGLDMNKVYELEQANKTEELFKYLLIVQCNALNSILPGMFQRIEDYTELLLPDYLLRDGSVVEQMVTTIPEEDWTDQVQIIGWLYQYYNTEPKDKVFADLKKNIKITKENIPAATQLFTPDWIVHYMVENSLGRLWLEGHPNDALKSEWKYYLDEAEQEPEVQAQLAAIRKEYAALKPEEIRVIDPCMGSGHILCVLFDVFVRIYEDYGYPAREAAVKIVENNLWGLDIDERAAQLSYFAVMMKARQYDRRFFTRKVQPHVYAIHETNAFGGSYKQAMGDFRLSKEHQETLQYLMDAFVDAKEYGSILQIENRDYAGLKEAWNLTWSQTAENVSLTLWSAAVAPELSHLIEQAIALSQKYDVVVTNPPYMGNMSAHMTSYVREYYKDEKYDLYSVFVKRAFDFTIQNGFVSMITQQAWMFLSSFDRFRNNLKSASLVNMAHLGARAFEEISGEVVQTVAFIFKKKKINQYKGVYINLTQGMSQDDKEKLFFITPKVTSGQNTFEKIPGNVYAYWVPEKATRLFSGTKLGDVSVIKSGIVTGDNNYFLRLWYEITRDHIDMDYTAFIDNLNIRWVPMHKGGGYRKHYGLHEYVMNLHDIWEPEKANVSVRRGDPKYYFREGLTWTTLSNSLSVRQSPTGFVFDTKGSMCFPNSEENLSYLEAFLNSKVAAYYMSFLSPTLDFNQGAMAKIPFIRNNEYSQCIVDLSKKCVEITKQDWDSFETSWDFQCHPVVRWSRQLYDATSIGATMAHYYGGHPKVSCPLKLCFMLWKGECEERFQTLKASEEELNRIFIDIYGLQDELTPEVEDRDVTVRRADLGRDIRSLISYAVGCMFGRYSLDVEGLVYAGGDFDTKYCRWIRQFGDQASEEIDENGCLVHGGWAGSSLWEYDGVRKDGKWVASSYLPDTDNIIPICDDEYFDDDITGRFIKWVEVVFGKDTLEENLKFIADALGGKGSSREVIRNYFLGDFYADHLKIYQKRPIYWLFDSGKRNGFKCLIYMHRYQPDTIARIRTDYVHEQQSRYRTAIADLEQRINGASTSERVKLNKQLQKLQAQAEEIRAYEEKIHHLADQMIRIDLDDGVKVNYAKFQDVLAKTK